MNSSEPPSRIPESNPNTQAYNDELTSKGRVEKVREIDADESRKRKFQRFYEAAATPPPPTQKSNIFEHASEQEKETGPATSKRSRPQGNEEGASTSALPQSGQFWHDVDTAANGEAPKKVLTQEDKKKKKKQVDAGPVAAAGKKHTKEEAKLKESFIAPSLEPMPPASHEMAMNAMQQTPVRFTSSDISTLFYTMVGTIHIMTQTAGIHLTEVTLNNPAFANSVFYGATIQIAKYATAPDSFNITLSGSEEAVKKFQANTALLMEAFRRGKFTFRINRIDAQYQAERPLFRRKEKKDSASSSDMDSGGLK